MLDNTVKIMGIWGCCEQSVGGLDR